MSSIEICRFVAKAKIGRESSSLLRFEYVILNHLPDGTPTSFRFSGIDNFSNRFASHIRMTFQLGSGCKVNINF